MLRCLTSVLFMGVSTLVVHILHPTVRGSGIPEMKLFLANWESPRMKDYLSCRALFTKTVGLGLSILSGFPVGKEVRFAHNPSVINFSCFQGPFVHISCAIAYFVKFKMVPTITDFIAYNCRKTMLLSNLTFSKVIYA